MCCEDVCTWTRLDVSVQLRPQFGHLDALHEQEKATARSERTVEGNDADGGEEKEAKAVNMAVKQTDDNDESDLYGGMSETAKLLKSMRDEPWQRLTWVDQEVESQDFVRFMGWLLTRHRIQSHTKCTMNT